jgi:hypothetical protein
MRAIDRAVYNWYGSDEEKRAFARHMYRHERAGFWKCIKRAYYRHKRAEEALSEYDSSIEIPYTPRPRPEYFDPFDLGLDWYKKHPDPDI